MFSTKTLVFVICALSAITTHAETPTPKLTLDDIDQLSRAKVVDSLKGADSKGGSMATTPQPTASAPAPLRDAHVFVPRATPRVDHLGPVMFVGAYHDERGASFVLYEFRGGVYQARVGTELLNGWTARKVDGFRVTVSEGRGKNPRTWTETMRAEAPPVQVSSAPGTLQAINDLGSPLPPGGISAVSNGFVQGR